MRLEVYLQKSFEENKDFSRPGGANDTQFRRFLQIIMGKEELEI